MVAVPVVAERLILEEDEAVMARENVDNDVGELVGGGGGTTGCSSTKSRHESGPTTVPFVRTTVNCSWAVCF